MIDLISIGILIFSFLFYIKEIYIHITIIIKIDDDELLFFRESMFLNRGGDNSDQCRQIVIEKKNKTKSIGF